MDAEWNYTTTEREALAMVFSVKNFRHYLLMNKVIFFVDHMALQYLVNKPDLSGRLARWILLLTEFDYSVQYKPRKMHLQEIIFPAYLKKWAQRRSMMSFRMDGYSWCRGYLFGTAILLNS